MATVEAVRKEMGCHVVGCIKTGHARFPIQAMRWTLAEMERGDHVVMEHEDEEGNKTWAVGWSDVHYKTCVTTHGSTGDGEPASKKRQRLVLSFLVVSLGPGSNLGPCIVGQLLFRANRTTRKASQHTVESVLG